MNAPFEVEQAKALAHKFDLTADFIAHQESGKTTADAERALGCDASQIIKTLILRASRENQWIGVVILGSDRLDTKAVASAAKMKKLRFADPEEVSKLTGYCIGGVPPMAVSFCNQSFVDRRVITKDFVIGAGGNEFHGMKFSPAEFTSKLNVTIIDAAIVA
jgi:prolyl-tRNA editing enzyme YbaK/EbsC (Cys-tRNA(Pro) deacylase)